MPGHHVKCISYHWLWLFKVWKALNSRRNMAAPSPRGCGGTWGRRGWWEGLRLPSWGRMKPEPCSLAGSPEPAPCPIPGSHALTPPEVAENRSLCRHTLAASLAGSEGHSKEMLWARRSSPKLGFQTMGSLTTSLSTVKTLTEGSSSHLQRKVNRGIAVLRGTVPAHFWAIWESEWVPACVCESVCACIQACLCISACVCACMYVCLHVYQCVSTCMCLWCLRFWISKPA